MAETSGELGVEEEGEVVTVFGGVGGAGTALDGRDERVSSVDSDLR